MSRTTWTPTKSSPSTCRPRWEDPNPDVFLMAVADVAKAKGVGGIASATGLGRESLYKAFAPGAKPRYDTVLKVLRALGMQLHAVPTVDVAT